MCIAWSSVALWNPRELRVTQNEFLSLLAHTKQLLLVTFCDMTIGIGFSFWTRRRREAQKTDEQTDMKVEIVI